MVWAIQVPLRRSSGDFPPHQPSGRQGRLGFAVGGDDVHPSVAVDVHHGEADPKARVVDLAADGDVGLADHVGDPQIRQGVAAMVAGVFPPGDVVAAVAGAHDVHRAQTRA